MEASAAQLNQGGLGLGGWWDQQSPNQRVMWILLGSVFLAMLAFLSLRANSPEYVPVYSGLAQADAASMGQVLDTRGIRYRLNDSGTALLVPTRERDRARIAIAGEGVLPSGPQGYEILDNPNPFSLSDFTQRVNLQRAREGELARTLMSLDAIRDARVLLTIPEDSPFLSEHQAPGASVALKLRGGSRALSGEEASTIANLIAAAVPGLDPDNVVIVDQHATLLAGPNANPAIAYDSEGRSVIQQFEAQVSGKVMSLLEAAYGRGNVRVSVSAELDLDRVASTKETFMPDATGKGVPRSEEITDESTQNAPASDGGIAGTASNIPSYPTPDSTGGESKTKRSGSTINYEISSTREVIEKAPGAVKRLSVSVLLDQPDLDATVATQINSLVRAAVNFDEARGDLIEVQALPFNTEAEEELKKDLAAGNQQQMIDTSMQAVGWLIVVGLFAWGTIQIVKVVGPAGGMSGGVGGGARGSTLMAMGAGGNTIEIERPKLSPEEQAKAKIRDEIMDIAKVHPDEAAKVIRAWLRE